MGHVGKMYAHGDGFFLLFFFSDLIPLFFLLSLSHSLPFLLPLVCISYAGPFEPHLIGVDWTAFCRYNGKRNIFCPKI